MSSSSQGAVSRRMARSARRRSGGLTSLEYLMLLPLLLMCLLVTVQLALLLQGWLLVQHAALTAVRSAVAVVPVAMRSRSLGTSERVNEIAPATRSPKHEFVRRAAAMALTSAAPPWSVELGVRTGIKPALPSSLAFTSLAVVLPGSAEAGGAFAGANLALRSAYTLDPSVTRVNITLGRGASAQDGIVRVRVKHRLFLAIPFADRLFGQAFYGGGWLSFAARYREIEAEYALPVDLRPLFPAKHQAGIYFEEVVFE